MRGSLELCQPILSTEVAVAIKMRLKIKASVMAWPNQSPRPIAETQDPGDLDHVKT